MERQRALARIPALCMLLWYMVAGLVLPTAAQRKSNENAIVAIGNPYRIEWGGTQGVFIRKAYALEKEKRLPLTFIHTDPGPKGFSKHLAWFLAREKDEFAILWCYLNDTGRDFWCWLYRFPSNQLTTIRFTGEYRFIPPNEPVAAKPFPELAIRLAPNYQGPDFSYKGWTRRAGSLENLVITPTIKVPATAQPITIPKLNVVPLHDVRVQAKNGWREGGWGELHTLAYDRDGAPYYLILYDNSTRGFVLNLKQAQLYTADFEEKVVFGRFKRIYGEEEPTTLQPTIAEPPKGDTVKPYELFEVTFKSKQTYTLPTLEVAAEADVASPDGKQTVVPLFWDGEGVWRLRLAPGRVGTWAYRVRSNDADLHNQIGTFDCEAEKSKGKGFLYARGQGHDGRYFAWADGTPLFAVPLTASVATLSPQEPVDPKAEKSEVTSLPPSFRSFQRLVVRASEAGVNRFTDFWLLDGFNRSNEGGESLQEADLNRLNPAFFQWLDRRIAFCNYRGIVPDIGMTRKGEATLSHFEESQVRRLWRYVVSRYAGYNVCWVLSGTPLSDRALAQMEVLAKLTRQIDSHAHPLLTALSEAQSQKEVAWVDGTLTSTLTSGAVRRIWDEEHPVCVRENLPNPPAKNPNVLKGLWETLFQGATWQPILPEEETRPLEHPATQALLSASRLFQTTRFSRLSPQPDLLKSVVPKTSVQVLANPGKEYLLYFPQKTTITLDLLEAIGKLKVLWYRIKTAVYSAAEEITGGENIAFVPPEEGEWVLVITRVPISR